VRRGDQLEHAAVRRAQAAKGKKAYVYYFTRIQTVNGQPSPGRDPHRRYLVPRLEQSQGPADPDLERRGLKLADTMSSYWVNFITKGDP
jgi:carboxylesterase type B